MSQGPGEPGMCRGGWSTGVDSVLVQDLFRVLSARDSTKSLRYPDL